jgi:SRSO17 transposase
MLKKLVNKLYNNIRTELTSYQWHSFLSMVIGICITDGKKSLKALTYLASSPALSRFFNGDKWPSKLIKRVQRKLVLNLIKRHYWNQRGRNPTVYLLIDGTVLPKRGENLPKVGLHYDTRTGDLRRGQKLVISSLKVGELLLPWDFRVYVNKEKCKEADFKKSTQQAAEMIREFKSSFPLDCEVVVAVDGGLCVKRVIEAADEVGFALVGRVRKDRKLADERIVSEVNSGTVAKLKGIDIPVQVVDRYMEGQREILISTNTSITPVQVRRRMKRRWWAEKMNGELKSLGLEDCSCRGEYSVERWAGLVMLAFTLLATVRWEESNDQLSSWRRVGQKLAQALIRNGKWWEKNWLSRGLAHLKSKTPLLEPLLRLLNLQLHRRQVVGF